MNVKSFNYLLSNSKNNIFYVQDSSKKFRNLSLEKDNNNSLKKNNSSVFPKMRNIKILGNSTSREKFNLNEYPQRFKQVRENFLPKIKLHNLLFQNPKKYDLKFQELFPLNYTKKNFSSDNISFNNDSSNINDFTINNKKNFDNNNHDNFTKRFLKINHLKHEIYQILENKFLEYKYLKKLYKKEQQKEIENQKINIEKKNKEKKIKLIKITIPKKTYDFSQIIIKNFPLSTSLKNLNDEGTQTYKFLHEKH